MLISGPRTKSMYIVSSVLYEFNQVFVNLTIGEAIIGNRFNKKQWRILIFRQYALRDLMTGVLNKIRLYIDNDNSFRATLAALVLLAF